jgi:spore maturation protein CgeB
MSAIANGTPSGSVVRRAAEAFARGDYGKALEFYEQLAELIGQNFFLANLNLCKHRLARNRSAALAQSPTVAKRKFSESALVLGPDPIWRDIATHQAHELCLTYSLDFPPILLRSADKVAVVVVGTLDSGMRLIEPTTVGLPWSERLKSHFVYLKAPAEGALQANLNIPLPKGTHTVRLGFRTFELPPDSIVTLRSLTVEASAFNRPSEEAIQLMAEGWPVEHDTGKIALLAVLDEFTANCLRNNVNLVSPRPDNWLALADRTRPSLAFVESAWKGNEGSWQYRVGKYDITPGKELEELCSYARTVGMPTVFWNKEDPVHHAKFLRAASHFDHIFTTDERMVNSYVSRAGSKSVHVLPFAAAPHLHYPAPLEGRLQKCCFAGSWYGNRHERRAASMTWLIRAAKKHGLDIYDRNSGAGGFSFPAEFAEHTKPRVPYEALCSIYRTYRVFLNVNSVEDSPSMFSRRVFELLACGTPVVSTYARGIEEILGTDAVWLVRDEMEADEAIRTLLSDDKEWQRRSRAGIRQVFAAHTYAHRLDDVFRVAGVSAKVSREPLVLLIAHTTRQEDVESLGSFAESQSYTNFRVLTSGSRAKHCAERLDWAHPLDRSLADCVFADYDAIGLIDLRCSYGPHYLRDLVNAMCYRPDADGWSKALTRDSYCFGQPWLGSASLLKPSVFSVTKPMLLGEPTHSLTGHGVFSVDVSEFSPAPAGSDLLR